MDQQIVIDSRFCGPPDSGNGGYLSGLIAAHFVEPVEVTLIRPVPMGRALTLEWYESVVLICDGDELVALAEQTTVDAYAPPAPTYQDAVHATRFRVPDDRHPFPGCFVCGPLRDEGDGLRIFVGTLEGTDVVAAPWVPRRDLADANGRVKDEFVCAALDCPGGFAAKANVDDRPAVLGQFAARIEGTVKAGERYILVGWKRSRLGRKHDVGTALFSANGTRKAVARATWIDLDSQSD